MHLELKDSRRLTGANLHWGRPSAIIDVAIDGPFEPVIRAWESAARNWLQSVGYEDEKTCYRVFDGGASLLISAPIDVLYSMCELNELAWASAVSVCAESETPDPGEEVPRLTRLFDEERNPALLALQTAAGEHGVPFLWDDDEVSLGYGKTTRIWKPDALPSPEEIEWDGIAAVPLALVTGTNGKSTTVRMTAAIMTAAGFRAGLTSTDFIRVGDRIIDTGDYSGTGGARMLMRQSDVEMAVLEVARGGLLRRGLGVEHADAAVVSNVAADHLGDYGINTVPELIPAKFIVSRALDGDAPLILNADDEGVVEFAGTLDNRITWFSLDPDQPQLTRSIAGGGTACYLENGWLMAAEGSSRRRVVPVAEIPAAMGGIVRYNISNALAAMCIATSLGIDDGAIRKGLAIFRGDEHDNPGRGNWFEHHVDDGVIRILVDFAHNEHGMQALADAVRRVPAKRVILLMGQAGDRPDKDIIDLAKAACSMGPSQLMVAELPGYERGREPFEVPELIRQEALRSGVSEKAIEIFPGPKEATAEALGRAKQGDLLVLLALTQRNAALSLVHEFIGNGKSGHG
jgi:UDP-N-acetylmuramyl tripeptide synthase